MIRLTHLFESIFDTSSQNLENQAIIRDHNSEFYQKWAEQLDRYNSFDLENRILHVIKPINKSVLQLSLPLKNFITPIDEIHFTGDIYIKSPLRVHFDKNLLTETISSDRDIEFYIPDGLTVTGINFRAGLTHGGFFRCLTSEIKFINCAFLADMLDLRIRDLGVLSNCFEKCKCDVNEIYVYSDNIFKKEWKEFNNVVDLTEISAPYDSKKGDYISIPKPSIKQFYTFMSADKRYRWGGRREFALKYKGHELLRALFPGCEFNEQLLQKITIRNNRVKVEIMPFKQDKQCIIENIVWR